MFWVLELKSSFKITTICQSQVFYSVLFLIKVKRGHVSHWEVKHILNKNTFILSFCPEKDKNLSLDRNKRLCKNPASSWGGAVQFWWLLSFFILPMVPFPGQAGLSGYHSWKALWLSKTSLCWLTGTQLTRLFKPFIPQSPVSLIFSQVLPSLQWQLMDVGRPVHHLPRTPGKTFAF